jgi:predicted aldo/keto reductase-like oxidoreductase
LTDADARTLEAPARFASFGTLGRVCRLGLATRGNTHLDPEAVLEAVERGVNFLNWCGHPDGLSEAVRQLGGKRGEVKVAVQLAARTADAARRELDEMREQLGTAHLDVVTYYYVEHAREWEAITARGGAADVVERARHDGAVGAIGLTSHQRPLAAQLVASGRLDALMVRYNAGHRGAENDVFPVCDRAGIPVITYTGTRWGALMKSTPDDPAGWDPPRAPAWYRFVLCHPSVTVGLMAPDGREELREDLEMLECWRGFSETEYAALRAHGDRVRRHGGRFS